MLKLYWLVLKYSQGAFKLRIEFWSTKFILLFGNKYYKLLGFKPKLKFVILLFKYENSEF